jgi:hypothetical protein
VEQKLGEWLVEQKKVEAGEAREAKQKKKLDLLWACSYSIS